MTSSFGKNHLLRSKFALCVLGIICVAPVLAETKLPAVDCLVQPFDEVELGSPVAGIIEDIRVEKSDLIRAGQIVAQLEDGVEQATVKLAEARAEVNAQLESERVNLAYDRKSRARVDSLYGQKVISVGNKDDADREAELSHWRLEQAKDLRRIRKLELARARELVEQKIIRSPIDGFVVERYRSIGEFVEDQPLLRIAQLDPLQIEAILPIEHFGEVAPGMVAQVKPELASISAQQAEVILVDRIGDAASRTFSIRLAMPNPDYKIPAGLKCELKFEASDVRMANSFLNSQATQKQRPSEPIQPASVSNQAVVQTTSNVNSIGPFKSQTSARRALSKLVEQHGLSPDTVRIEENATVIDQFMVVTSEDDSRALRDKLQEFDHIQVVDGSERRYSLGVYNYRSRAERHRNMLGSHGIATFIRERKQRASIWHVVVDDANLDLAGFEG